MLHRWGGSHQVAEYTKKPQVALELIGFPQTPSVLNRTFQQGPEGARFNRLLQVPERLEVVNSGQRFFHAPKAGERDCGSGVAAFFQMPEQFEAVHARHDQIRNDDVCVEGSEPFQRFLPVGRDLRVVGTPREHGGQSGTLALVVIDDEDPARNRRGAPPRGRPYAGYLFRVGWLGEHIKAPPRFRAAGPRALAMG